MEIHSKIKEKLEQFKKNNNVPHILFYGPPGSGKKTLVHNFISSLYETSEIYNQNVMIVNCALGKGIQFIRENMKQFAKSHVYSKNKFKSILLLNADKLTVDAQSALRRCIEIFSNTTRFFIIIESKHQLLKPILSRFCDIHIPYENINNKQIHLYKYKKDLFEKQNTIIKKNNYNINRIINKCRNEDTNLFDVVDKLIMNGYSCYDIINKSYVSCDIKMLFSMIKSYFKNEELLMYNILFYIFRYKDNLEILSIIK
jgi:DNA polymerase III delta prime subunit